MMQGCRLARLFGKRIMDFYARNQYFLMNTQPTKCAFWLLIFLFIFLYIINVEKLMRLTVENTLIKLIKKSVIL